MFKSEKQNLIASIIVWITALIVVYSFLSFKAPLWFNIIFPLLIGESVFRNAYKVLKGKKTDGLNGKS